MAIQQICPPFSSNRLPRILFRDIRLMENPILPERIYCKQLHGKQQQLSHICIMIDPQPISYKKSLYFPDFESGVREHVHNNI